MWYEKLDVQQKSVKAREKKNIKTNAEEETRRERPEIEKLRGRGYWSDNILDLTEIGAQPNTHGSLKTSQSTTATPN